jgi:predicted nucleic acid-binding protein
VLEVCGIASFNTADEDLKKLFYAFHQTYDLQVLYPVVTQRSPQVFLKDLVADAFARILTKINFNDALILSTAEAHDATDFVTWNVKHFAERTDLRVLNPRDFLATYPL